MSITQLKTVQVVDETDKSNVITAEIYVPPAPDSSRETIVLLPFWGGTAETYARVQLDLIQRLPHNPTIAISYRGTGKATHKDMDTDGTKHTVDNLSAELLRFLQHDSVSQLVHTSRLILCGHSISAKIALLAAIDGKAKGVTVSSVVLIAPAPPTPLILERKEIEARKNAYNSVEIVQYTLKNVLAHNELEKPVRENLMQGMLSMSQGAREGWMEYGLSASIEDSTKEYSKSNKGNTFLVAVIVGRQDLVETPDMVDKDTVNFLEGAGYNVRSTVVENCGHLLPLEKPEALSDVLLDMITSEKSQ